MKKNLERLLNPTINNRNDIGIVKKERIVETTIVLAILLTASFDEYIDPTK